jgi:pimeloyl-ACP methyl ester carboxylesterase
MASNEPPFTFVPSTSGVQVAVHHLGGPSDPAAPLLLFSHATGFHGRVWGPMASELTDRYQCLAIDYRGHGLSELPPGTSLTWSGMADDALAVLSSPLIPAWRTVHGVAHSMGGAVLALAAARDPGRFRSLWLYEPVLVPPGRLPHPADENPMAAGAIRRRTTFSSYDEAIDHYASKPPLNQLHPDALRAYVSGGFAPQPDGTITLRCRPDTEAAVFLGAHDNGAWETLPTLPLPVAVVAGRSDEFGPASFAPLAAAELPFAELLERPGLGHFGPLEDPTSMAHDVAQWAGSHA